MKKFYILFAAALLAGCAYNQITNTNSGSGNINCTATAEKPVDVLSGAGIQGNVPVNGGSVTNPTNNVAQKQYSTAKK